ncbi:MAG: hypothetical protein OCC49_09780 [Fibrobacterales bacterium]
MNLLLSPSKYLILFFLFIFTSCGYQQQVLNNYLKNPEKEVTFTTGLNDKKFPIDSFNSISMSKVETFYIYSWWYNIPRKTWNFRYNIYDGAGRLVCMSHFDWKLGPGRKYRTWLPYTFNKKRDIPGKWRIELYLDDTLVSEHKIQVKI